MNTYKGISYAILSSVAFGLMPIFASIAYENGSNPTTVIIFRFLLSSISLFIYLLYKKVKIKIKRKPMLILLGIGIIAYTITTQTLFMSYNYLGAGLATTLHFIYPAIVCIIGFVFLKEKISQRKLISLLLSGIGVYSLVAFESKSLSTIGIFLALFSGVAYAINLIILGLDCIKSVDNKISTLYMCVGATLGMITYGLFTNSIVLTFNIKMVGSYIGISLISTIVSIILLLKAIELIGPSSTSILGTFEPIVSIIFGVLILGENLSFELVIGAALILTATIVLAKDTKSE
ncbi:DMT family transporter [Clostridium botulinum]|uniref:DMT family transporter n=1 Tax=unclassified Clostridium TaxID=2614128 RepID=UPI001D90C2F0|nr:MULTISPECIES: DMT family transporter [unclassified Clostridium]MBN1052301.1 DMT family transporter [Clostridium botulinum]MBN1055432.1 DMT family transporter [Clostridium botulinum]